MSAYEVITKAISTCRRNNAVFAVCVPEWARKEAIKKAENNCGISPLSLVVDGVLVGSVK